MINQKLLIKILKKSLIKQKVKVLKNLIKKYQKEKKFNQEAIVIRNKN